MIREIPAKHDREIRFELGVPDVDCHARAATRQLVKDGVLHGGVLQYFDRTIPWCSDQTLSAAGHQQRGDDLILRPRRNYKPVSNRVKQQI